MIVETIVGLFLDMLLTAFSGLQIIGLPLNLIGTLQTIVVYGVWVVGVDILAVFAALIVGWWALKFAVCLVIFVWDLLPLT